jgi:hypothetical protein
MADDRVQVYDFSTEQKDQPQRSWKCDGSLWPQTAIDMHSGVRVQVVSQLQSPMVCR